MYRALTVAAHSFRLWKLKGRNERRPRRSFVVAAHSFRLWKLKDNERESASQSTSGCSSFVPIVETESSSTRGAQTNRIVSCSSFVPIVETESSRSWRSNPVGHFVAAHSFRLWKLKVEVAKVNARPVENGCSSFVPIVETERNIFVIVVHSLSVVAAHSFRLWKLKVCAAQAWVSQDE